MSQKLERGNGHAVVIGASIAGLLAARVLADHFAQVTVIERDTLPTAADSRKGVPQGRHLHVLLKRGEQVLGELFPGLIEEMATDGAVRLEVGRDLRWFHDGGHADRYEGGLAVLGLTRPLLEMHVRRRVLRDRRVLMRERCEVTRLLATAGGGTVTGVAARRLDKGDEFAVAADFVVDASGRGSRAPRWLAELGFPAPPTTEIRIGLHYTSRMYERDPALMPDAEGILTQPQPPGTRGGFLFPIEGDRWMVTLSGMLGDRAPADDAGFLDYARSLPSADIHAVIQRARPIGDFRTHAFPTTIRHHYEKLTRFPERFLVLGDAISSFNPVYGQGMSVAAGEASELQALLRDGIDPIAPRFFSAAARVIAAPWMIAVGADFRLPGVEGRRPLLSGLSAWYLSRFTRKALHDRDLALAFGDVLHLMRSPHDLLAPRIAWRVLAGTTRQRESLKPARAVAAATPSRQSGS